VPGPPVQNATRICTAVSKHISRQNQVIVAAELQAACVQRPYGRYAKWINYYWSTWPPWYLSLQNKKTKIYTPTEFVL